MKKRLLFTLALLLLCAFLFACGETPAESEPTEATTEAAAEPCALCEGILRDWLDTSEGWTCLPYGAWDGVEPSAYIVARYGENGRMPYTDYVRIIGEKLGVTDFRDRRGIMDKSDGVLYVFSSAEDRSCAYDLVGHSAADGVHTLTVQFYADAAKQTPSHLVQYRIGDDESLYGSTLLKRADCEPLDHTEYSSKQADVVQCPEFEKPDGLLLSWTMACSVRTVSGVSWLRNAALSLKSDLALSLPMGWSADKTGLFDLDGRRLTFDALYETVAGSDLSEYLPTVSTLPHLYENLQYTDTLYGEDLLVRSYPPADDESRLWGCLRVDENHVLAFTYEGGGEKDLPFLQSVLRSAASAPASEKVPAKAVRIDAESEQIELRGLYRTEFESLYSTVTSELPSDACVTLSIPKPWNRVVQTEQSGTVAYSEFPPALGVSPEACRFQGIWLGEIYPASDLPAFLIDEPEQPSVSAQGYPYWYTAVEKPQYHAVDYTCVVRFSAEAVLRFYLCVDSDDTTTVQRVIDSVRFYEGTPETTIAPSESATYVVKIREVIPVLEWQHTLPVAESDDPLRIVMTLPDEPASGLGVDVMGSATLNEVDSSEKMRKELVLSLAYMWGVNAESCTDGVTASGMPYVSSLSAIGQWTDRGIENQLSVYVRVADNYIWRCDFLFLQDTIPTQIYEALDSICLLGTLPQPYAVYDYSVPAERQTVTMTDLSFRSYDDWGTQGKSEVTVQLCLPQDWTNQSVSYAHDSCAYTPFAAPTHAGAANRAEVCPFPAFSYEETLLLTASDAVFDADFVGEESKYMSGYHSYKLLAKETEQGVTASGMPYVLFRCEIGDYRTTRYHAAVRLTDTYVFSFDLYTAPDDTALIDEILDSIRCVEKSGGA